MNTAAKRMRAIKFKASDMLALPACGGTCRPPFAAMMELRSRCDNPLWLASRTRVQMAIDREQDGAHRAREHEQQQCDRHDQIDIVQSDRGHEQVAEATLSREHLAQQR